MDVIFKNRRNDMFENFDILREIILPSGIGVGTALLAVKFLSKSLIKHALDKDIQKFKSELQEKTEVLKSSLSIYANEQGVSFQRIDQQRAKAIDTIYNNINEVSFKISSLITGHHDEGDIPEIHLSFYRTKCEEITDANTILNESLRRHAIYFDNETYKMINTYFNIVAKINIQFLTALGNIDFGKINIKKLKEERDKIKYIFESELTSIHHKTVDSFRHSLGIEKKRILD